MTRYPVALLAAALLMLVVPGSARAGDDDPFRDDGSIRYRFYTELEYFYVERDRTPDVEVSFDDNFTPSREVLSTDDVVDDDEQSGGRFLLGFRFNRTSAIEASYMAWGHERSATVRRNDDSLDAFEFPDLGLILDDGNFDAADVHDLEYDEDFHSGELNYRHAIEVDGAQYRFNLLAGIRAIRLEEDLALTSLDDFPVGPGDIGKFDIATRNTLIGGQVGVETFVPLWRDVLDLDLMLKLGGYANQAQVRIDYDNADFPPPSDEKYRDSRIEWDPAGVFEAAVHFKARIWRGVRLNVGYRAVYLVNIAAAPDQFPRSGSAGDFFGNTFDNDGVTVFHGPSLALGVDF